MKFSLKVFNELELFIWIELKGEFKIVFHVCYQLRDSKRSFMRTALKVKCLAEIWSRDSNYTIDPTGISFVSPPDREEALELGAAAVAENLANRRIAIMQIQKEEPKKS